MPFLIPARRAVTPASNNASSAERRFVNLSLPTFSVDRQRRGGSGCVCVCRGARRAAQKRVDHGHDLLTRSGRLRRREAS